MSKTKSGFTIVELLVVIVVVGILATITIVVYNGIQQQAENAKTVAAVNAYTKALTNYQTVNGAFPASSASGMCLGEDYPIFTGGSAAACYSRTTPVAQTTNAAVRDNLKTFMGGSLPMPSKKILSSATNEYVGIMFYGTANSLTLDGQPMVSIFYIYQGSSCPTASFFGTVSNPWPTLSSVNKGPYATDGSILRCNLLLPVG